MLNGTSPYCTLLVTVVDKQKLSYPTSISVTVTNAKGASCSGTIANGTGSFNSTNADVGVYNWTYNASTGYYTIKRSKANSSTSVTYTLSGGHGVSGTYTGKQPSFSGYALRDVWN